MTAPWSFQYITGIADCLTLALVRNRIELFCIGARSVSSKNNREVKGLARKFSPYVTGYRVRETFPRQIEAFSLHKGDLIWGLTIYLYHLVMIDDFDMMLFRCPL